ncbi:MAG: proline racemase family protein [Candidatus Limnocylindrales bacterium]
MQTQLPVIRTYTGPDREATQEAYRRDARQARATGWVPVAHRWRMDGDAHELAVVFELHVTPAEAASTAGEAPVPEAGPDVTAFEEQAAHLADEPDDGVTEAANLPEPASLPEAALPADVPTLGTRHSVAAAVASVSVARARARATIETIDLHAGGEPIRLVRSGYPKVPLAPILERRRWVREHADSARRALMYEPRGHRDMYGAVLLPPHREDADIAVLFMHNEGYSTMCGHGIIALTTGLIEEGLYPASVPRTTIRWETPAGVVTATASTETAEDGHVEVSGVSFVNVPAYLHARDLVVRPSGVGLAGPVGVQLAFGGAYYGIVDAAEIGLRVVPESIGELTRMGAAITEVLRADHLPVHPVEPELGFVYGTIIVDMDPATSPDGRATDATMRNVTVFADAEVDRSPCGSGTSALLAWLHGAGRIAIGDGIANASITGAVFQGRIEGATRLGDRFAVSTSVAGTGYVTGYHTFVVDERDPLGDGFLLH